MRGPVRLGDGRLRSSCANLSAVLARTEGECGIRHGMLVNAVREVCSGPVEGLTTVAAEIPGSGGGPAVAAVIAAVNRGPLGMVPVDRLGDGELRFLALALVLLTGPDVLDVDTSTELLPAGQVLTVVADGLDLGLDRRQARELLRLAGLAAARGHIRLLGTVQDLGCADGIDGVTLTMVGAEPENGVRGAGEGGQRPAGAAVADGHVVPEGHGGDDLAAGGEPLDSRVAGPGPAGFLPGEDASGERAVADRGATDRGVTEGAMTERAAVDGEDEVDQSA
jgi:hypothetical protein